LTKDKENPKMVIRDKSLTNSLKESECVVRTRIVIAKDTTLIILSENRKRG